MKSILKLSALAAFIIAIAFVGCKKVDKYDKKDCKKYDCKELKLNFKDKCKTRDGKVGYVDKNCNCVVKVVKKFDCEKLQKNYKDMCKTRDGKKGFINKKCECEAKEVEKKFDCEKLKLNYNRKKF